MFLLLKAMKSGKDIAKLCGIWYSVVVVACKFDYLNEGRFMEKKFILLIKF